MREELNKLTETIIGCAINVHRELGPGLLESAYQACLEHELGLNYLTVEKEHPVPVVYKGIHLDCGYRLDLFVERKVIVELKAVDMLAPIHEAQLISYLRLTNTHLGLLINFHVPMLKDGIRRLVYGQPR